MEATARARFVRFAPRKVNQVLSLIRRKNVPEALTSLSFAPKICATLIGKTIKSAAANAGDREAKNAKLYVTSAFVGQGPVMKRMRAAAMGRGVTIKKKTCHLTIVVSDKI
jgi:large subunit ribosomal protein L22